MSPAIDTRTPQDTYRTKGNIFPQDAALTLAPNATGISVAAIARDASAGASALVTDDRTGVAASTGPLPAGTYDVTVTLRHPGASAANRSLSVVHRNAADAADVAVVAFNAPAEAQYSRQFTLAANERLIVRTGSDATNVGLFAAISAESAR